MRIHNRASRAAITGLALAAGSVTAGTQVARAGLEPGRQGGYWMFGSRLQVELPNRH